MLDAGTPYVAVDTPRVVINENAGWQFSFNPSGTPQTRMYDDHDWQAVHLPHTWNNVDAATIHYASGHGWYRKTMTIDAGIGDRKLYLDFAAGSLTTGLFIDGIPVDFKPATPSIDTHDGGFADFLFDVTRQLTPGVPHVIAVDVDNQTNKAVPPAGGGDYSKEGGLYRGLSLLALPRTRIARLENVTHTGLSAQDAATPVATPGVYFSHSTVAVGATSAAVSVRTVLDNDTPTARPVTVTSYLVDAAGIVRAAQMSTQTLDASSSGIPVVQSTTLANPHLWNGRIDPYLYDLDVEVRDAATQTLLDATRQRVGIRSFTVNANAANDSAVAPFLLNGRPYALVGFDMHQDTGRPDPSGRPAGWAQSEAQVHADVDLLLDAGATVIRTAHYQHSQAFYDWCDRVGMLVYTESPINGIVTPGDAYLTNAQDQYQELIRQTFNNPSVFAWGFGNETSGSPEAVAVFRQLNGIAHGLDPSRKTGFAQYGGSPSTADNLDGVADIKGTHRYDHWYGGDGAAGAAAVLNTLHAYPTQPLAITEMGAGGSAYQYADGPIRLPVSAGPGGVKTHFHPENRQALIAATQMAEYATLNNLWARVVWQAFDSPSTGKNEGDQGGVNDKGVATRDRVLKDAYYFYQSLWNDPSRAYANRKVVLVADHFWTTRNTAAATVSAYSNLGPPTLTLNGKTAGVMAPLVVTGAAGEQTMLNAYVLKITLAVGRNTVSASCVASDGATTSDAVEWSYDDAATFAADRPVATDVAVRTQFVYDPVTKTTANPFHSTLPNGLYDVRITAPAGGVNNLTLQGEPAAIDTNGADTADTFYARIRVTDGRLTLAAGPGAYDAAVATIDIGIVETPPASRPVGE